MNEKYSRFNEIQILEAVERVAASGALGTGERLEKMLRYLVGEELAGRGDRIKGFSIATDVLGRDKTFDPQIDSIARAEMARLRKALELHYATDGKQEPFKIIVPKGSYRPEFTQVQMMEMNNPERSKLSYRDAVFVRRLVVVAATVAIAAGIIWLKPSSQENSVAAAIRPELNVLPVIVDSSTALAAGYAEGLQAELAARLSEQPWLTVLLPSKSSAIGDLVQASARTGSSYELDVRAQIVDGTYHLRAFLKSSGTGAIKWQRSYAGNYISQNAAKLVSELADEIAKDFGTPDGLIGREKVIRAAEKSFDSQVGEQAEKQFLCLVNARGYWRSYEPDIRKEAESCLSRLVADDPSFTDGRAALSILKTEDARRSTGSERIRHLDGARALLNVTSNEAQLPLTAKLALAACEGTRDNIIMIAGQLLARFPYDPASLADGGNKLGLAADDWIQSTALETKALAPAYSPDPWYPLSAVVRLMLDNKPKEALAVMSKVPQQKFITGHVTLLAIGGMLGDKQIIQSERHRLQELGIKNYEEALALVEGECWSDKVKQLYRNSIRLAATYRD